MELQDQEIGGVLQQKPHNRAETYPTSSKQQPLPPRIDNIAHLYSQLQAAFDKSSISSSSSITTHNNIRNINNHNHNNHNKPARVSLSDMQQRSSLSSSASVPSTCRSSTESGFYTPSNSSSNTNSPITPSHNIVHHGPEPPTNNLLDACACHHLLVSIDSEHCGICDEPLPKLQAWQQDRHLEFQTIDRSQSQLQRLQEKQQEYQEQIEQLVKDIHQKESSIERRTIELDSLQQDLKILHTKCNGERMQVKEIQKSKESVKRELEELSQRLFEEANEMVQIEKKEKERIQVEHEKSKQQLEQAQQALKQAESELRALRKDIGSLVETSLPPRPSSALSGYCESLRQDSSSVHHEENGSVVGTPTTVPMGPETVMMRAQIDLAVQHNSSSNMIIPLQIEASEDDHCLMEFRQFIDTASTVSLRKLHSLPYMKQCLEDDVRPTLRFGPNPRVTSRKIIDSILVKTCFIETCPRGFVDEQLKQQQSAETITSLWERFSSTPAFEGCQACGRHVSKEDREQVLAYRFRTSYFDEWTCIDSYCRDRLESVIQFYSFLRQLRISAYRHRSLTEVYQECSRLRLQMCLSRMGTLPAILQSTGFDPNSLARATPGSSNIGHLAVDDANSARLSSSTASTLTL